MNAKQTALFTSTQHWSSCFQLGSHHIARLLAARGWRVGFVSAPVGVPHLLGMGEQSPARLDSWRTGGRVDPDTGVWHYVPFAPLPWGAAPFLRSRAYVRLAWRLCRPQLEAVLGRAGFMRPSVAYTDHFLHQGLVDAARPLRTVFRRADNLAGFPGAGRDFPERELAFARSASLTICTTPDASARFARAGVDPVMTVPNGVNLERFLKDAPLPSEYRRESRPVVVYVGALEPWLDVDLLSRGAAEIRELCWVVIGPLGGAAADRLSSAGALVLGPKPHAELAGYLQHARVGLVPFSLTRHQELVRGISPLKVLEYSACGQAVVGTRGCQYPDDLPTPLAVCDSAEEFLNAVRLHATGPAPRRPPPQSFAKYTWESRLAPFLDWLDGQDTSSGTRSHAE